RGGAGGVRRAGERGVEGGALAQRPHRGQPPRRPGRHGRGQQFVAAAGRVDQAEQHPDGGGLAGSVGTEETVDRSARHRHVQPVHRELPTAEPLGQPVRGHGQAGRGHRRRGGVTRRVGRGYLQPGTHLTWAAAAYSTDGVTAPISTCPLEVISRDPRLVRTRLPLPQAPCPGCAAPSSVPSTAEPLTWPPPPDADRAAWPATPAALPRPATSDSAASGSTATEVQSLPMIRTPEYPPCCSWARS